jgi:hypothetical protein
VCEDVLLEWANSEDPNVRVLAAIAVNGASTDPDITINVLALLHHWSSSDNRYLAWTAGTAYCLPIGLTHPRAAVADLVQIGSGDIESFIVANSSMLRLVRLGRGSPEFCVAALSELVNRDKTSEDGDKSIVPLVLFLNLMAETEVTSQSGPSEARRPMLMDAAQADLTAKDRCGHQVRAAIASLTWRSMSLSWTRTKAATVLRQWVEYCDTDAGALPAVGKLMAMLAFDRKEKDDIVRYQNFLTGLAGPEKSNAAGKILSRIEEILNKGR